MFTALCGCHAKIGTRHHNTRIPGPSGPWDLMDSSFATTCTWQAPAQEEGNGRSTQAMPEDILVVHILHTHTHRLVLNRPQLCPSARKRKTGWQHVDSHVDMDARKVSSCNEFLTFDHYWESLGFSSVAVR